MTGTARPELTADCSRCSGLCCVVPAFSRSADFAIDKPAGTPCPNLTADARCGVHAELRDRGFRGCAVFDCFGAGQQITEVTFAGRDWQASPDAAAMPEVFRVMRALHELLRYLTEVLALPAAAPEHGRAGRLLDRVDRLTRGTPAELAAFDVAPVRQDVGGVLARVSELARARFPAAPDHRGADLAGRRLAGADLRGASLRGALLIATDLRAADLRDADLLGADLRDADLRGAVLTGALFLTPPQVAAARGDMSTRLPVDLARPAHWR